ncbi:hypothetical protein ACQ4LE_004644 [Meloidogyne hapla]|uniref:SHSP domain-containing protein n=1 Tax=Meloidogyne hapla TaxID=6305 RepID=A0A1I8C1W4_MELHA
MDSKGFLNPNPSFGKGEDDVHFLNQLPKLIIVQKPKGAQNFISPRRHSVNIPNENNIEVEHEVASEWDWPLQHTNGIVKVYNSDEKFEVLLDVQFFLPSEIEVNISGNEVLIHCLHEQRKNENSSVKREIHRCYRLPNDVKPNTLKCRLSNKGVLYLTAKK